MESGQKKNVPSVDLFSVKSSHHFKNATIKLADLVISIIFWKSPFIYYKI